jgi:preprotein translocase subunit SecB
MANAALVNQKIQEIHLSNKLEAPGQIQLDSSFSLNVSFSSDGSRCVGKLTQALRDKEFAGGKFTLSVEIVGIFNCSGAVTDDVKRQIHGEVYDQLFPHLQAQCSTLAAASGIPGLMLRKAAIDPNSIAINKGGAPGSDRNPDGGPKLTLL